MLRPAPACPSVTTCLLKPAALLLLFLRPLACGPHFSNPSVPMTTTSLSSPLPLIRQLNAEGGRTCVGPPSPLFPKGHACGMQPAFALRA